MVRLSRSGSHRSGSARRHAASVQQSGSASGNRQVDASDHSGNDSTADTPSMMAISANARPNAAPQDHSGAGARTPSARIGRRTRAASRSSRRQAPSAPNVSSR
jgi:hypothetical protein